VRVPNLDRAMAAARRYAELYARGDMALAGQEMRTIEDLGVGFWVEGKYTLPRQVAEAAKRLDLGPRYEVHGGGFGVKYRLLSVHTTLEEAQEASRRAPRDDGGRSTGRIVEAATGRPVLLSVEEVCDLLDRRGVSPSAFWSHAMGGDRAPMPWDVVQRMIVEVQP